MTPIPLEKVSALEKRLMEHFRKITTYNNKDNFFVMRSLQECNELIETNAPLAWALIGHIHAMCGDIDGAIAAIENAGRIGHPTPYTKLAAAYVNNGYATQGHKHVKMALSSGEAAPFQETLELAICSGAFHTVCSAVESANTNGTVLKIDPKMLNLAREAANVIDTLGHEHDIVAQMADHAGHVMRAKNLVWMNHTPTLRAAIDDDGEASLLYSYHVDVTPKDASDMNWQLAERLVDADLIRPGIGIEFVGERLGCTS